MKTETVVFTSILSLTVVLLAVGIFLLNKTSPKTLVNNEVYQIDYSKGQRIGSDSAKVKLVEFSDFQCPACKGAQPFVEKLIAENDSNFQFIYRHYPLSQHINAKAAAAAAEEAGVQGKFWEMHDKLFETQEKWEGLASPNDFFGNLAKELGLDENRVKDAITGNKFNDIIQEDLNDGNSYGLNATPTFYLNGKKLELANYTQLETQVKKALQE